MEQYIIKGGHPLVGEVEIGGAKNAALAILAAAIILAVIFITIVLVIILQDGVRKIPVQYSKKIQGRKGRYGKLSVSGEFVPGCDNCGSGRFGKGIVSDRTGII